MEGSSIMVNCLKVEKETFWVENQQLPEEEIRQRWLRRTAELKRQLTSVFDATPPLQQQSLTVEGVSGAQARHDLIFAQPAPNMLGTPSASSLSLGLDRTNNLSQQSTPMSRKRSSHSQHGPTPLANSKSTFQALPLNRWQTDDVEPFNGFGRPSKLQRTGLAPQPAVVYENPEHFGSMSENLQPSLSAAGCRKHYSRPHSYRLSCSPGQTFAMGSSLSQSPKYSMPGELTNAPTCSSLSMSRNSSLGGTSLCGGVDMMKINSQMSDLVSPSPCIEVAPAPSQADVELALDLLSDVHYPLLDGHMNRIVDDDGSPSSTASFLSGPFALPLPMQDNSGINLAKSTESSSSNQSRVTRRTLTEVNQNTRPIAPKGPKEASSSMAELAGHDRIRMGSDEGTLKAPVAIPKAPYVRPAHDKVKCAQCDEHPNGFRGEHELRRHTERKHMPVRKYFTCKDISPDKKFLASCKNCTSKKKYHAYYNATAHLRRAHFNPKQKGRKGKLEPEDRRGGKGGGTEPPMEVLKEWLETHEERAPTNMPPMADHFDDHENGEICNDLIGGSSFHHVRILDPTAIHISHLSHDITQPLLSAPVSIPQPYNNDCLQFTATNANASDILDLRIDIDTDTSIYDTSMADSPETLFPFDMSMSSYMFDGINHTSLT